MIRAKGYCKGDRAQARVGRDFEKSLIDENEINKGGAWCGGPAGNGILGHCGEEPHQIKPVFKGFGPGANLLTGGQPKSEVGIEVASQEGGDHVINRGIEEVMEITFMSLYVVVEVNDVESEVRPFEGEAEDIVMQHGGNRSGSERCQGIFT
jgi:hypothetical protein